MWQVTRESLAGAAAAVDGPLAAAVVGADPGDLIGLTDALDRAIVGNHSAKGAVDVALHDLAATTAGCRWRATSVARPIGCPWSPT